MQLSKDTIKDKDQQLAQKEELLTRMMKDYYSCDLQDLKTEVTSLTDEHISKLDQEKRKKLDSMNKDLDKILKLSKLHIEKGSKYAMPKQDDTEMMEKFDK